MERWLKLDKVQDRLTAATTVEAAAERLLNGGQAADLTLTAWLLEVAGSLRAWEPQPVTVYRDPGPACWRN